MPHRKHTISLKSFEKVTFVDIKKLMQSSDVKMFRTGIACETGCVQKAFSKCLLIAHVSVKRFQNSKETNFIIRAKIFLM